MAQRRLPWIYTYIPYYAAFSGEAALLPVFIVEVGGNVADVGILKASYNLTFIVGTIFWARLSDHYGKRRVFILIGLSSAAAVFLAFSLAKNVFEIVFLNAIMGFQVAALTPTTSILVVESSPRREWDSRMSQYNTVIAMGSMLGMLSGIILLNFIPVRSLFIIEAAFSFLAFVLAVLLVKDPPITLEREEAPPVSHSIVERMRTLPATLLHTPHLLEPHRLRKMLRYPLTRSLPILYLSVFLHFLGSIPVATVTPVFLKLSGVSNSTIFLILTASSITSILAFRKSASMAEKSGLKKPVASGASLRILAAAILSGMAYLAYPHLQLDLIVFVAIIIAAMAIWGSGYSLLWNPSQTAVARFADPKRRGQAQGMFNSSVAAATVLGALAGGFVAQAYGFTATYLMALLPMAVGMVVLKLIHD